MARTGDSLGYYYVEDYIEEGYIRYEPYIEDGYITEDYFLGEGVTQEGSATLTVSATLDATIGTVESADAAFTVAATTTTAAAKTASGSADFAGAFSPTIVVIAVRSGDVLLQTSAEFAATASAIRDNDVALSTLVNLSLQGDRTRDSDSTQSVAATLSGTGSAIRPGASSISSAFTPSITAVASLNGSIDLAITATQSSTALRIKQLNSSISAAASLTGTANDRVAIDATGRPRDADAVGTVSQNSVTVKWDTYSLDGEFQTDFDSTQLIGTDDFTMEGWFYVDSTNLTRKDPKTLILWANQVIIEIDNDQDDPQEPDFPKLTASYYNTSGTKTAIGSITSSTLVDQWVYYAVYRTGGTIYLRINNSQIATASYSGSMGVTGLTGSYFRGADIASDQILFDTTTFAVGKGTYAGTSEQPLQYYDYTLGYYTFEDTANPRMDVLDQPMIIDLEWDQTANATVAAIGGIIFGTSATLSVAASIAALGGELQSADATVAATATISATAQKIKSANSNLNAIFSQIATTDVIRRAATSLNAVFAQNASSTVTRGYDSALDITATQTTTGSRTRSTAVNLSGVAATVTIGSETSSGVANLATTATLAVEANTTAQGASTPNAAFAISTSVEKTVGFTVGLAAQAQLSADYGIIKSTGADLEAINATLIAANTIREAPIDLEISATVTADPTVIPSGQALLDATTGLSAQGLVTRQFDSTVSTAVTLTGVPQKTVTTDSTLNVSADLTAEASVSVVIVCELSGVSATVTTGARIASFLLEPDTVATLAVEGNVIPEGSSDLGVTATISATADRTRSSSSDLDSAASTSTDATKAVDTGVVLEAIADLSASAIKTTGIVSTPPSVFSLVANIGVIKRTQTQLDNTALVAANGQAQFSTSALLEGAFQPTLVAGILRSGATEMSSAFTLSATGRTIVVDAIVYTIPSETRTYTIGAESRNYTIHNETRTYTIQGD